MKKDNIIGIVIIYNFKIDDLIKNIDRYIFALDKLVIWINSPLNFEEKEKLNSTKYSERIEFMGTGKNKGISFPLNQVINKYKESYKYLLTMDQDSYWINFSDYIERVCNYGKNKDVYIYGPKIVVKGSFEMEKYKELKNENIHNVDHVITSGAIYEMKMFDIIGKFKESYFIDAVDEEICYRAKRDDINTIKIDYALLLQEYGVLQKYKLLWKDITYNKYSSSRLYYIVRNHIRLIRNYNFSFKKYLSILYFYLIRPIIMVLFFDKIKIKKLINILNGFIDGFKDD